MTQTEFLERVKDEIMEYLPGTDREQIVFPWSAKTLGNLKCTATVVPSPGVLPVGNRYFECTYNGQTGELYVDVYTKEKHFVK